MRRFILRLWQLVRHDQAEQSLARELATHVALLEEDYQRRGMSPTDARRAARLALGGVEQVKDRHRDARSFTWIEDARRDVVHTARLIRRNPIFALTAALSLAIGIGANSAIFTVANALLFRDPVGVADPSRLVDIGTARGDGGGMNPTSYPNYLDIRSRATLLSGVYAQALFAHAVSFDAAGDTATTGSIAPEPAYAHAVTTNYFTVLGATPLLGRFFDTRDSEQTNASPVAVLSHGFWTRRFGRNPAIVGQTVRVNGLPVTVIGVAQEQFQGTVFFASDLWLPMNLRAVSDASATAPLDRGSATTMIGARLKPGVSTSQAAAEVEAIGAALVREYPDASGARRGLRLVPSSRVPGNARLLGVFFMFLMIIVSLVLIVACANLAAILLARATARRREIAVRLAIGAGRARLVRQLLTETVMLFAIGGVAGLFLARLAMAVLIPLLPALPFPITVALALDGRVIAFTAAVSLVAALLSGLAPALQASRADVLTSLNSDSQGPSGRSRLRHAFVIAQVAFSLLLVVIAGLFVRALQQAGSIDPGFDPRGVELAKIDLSMGHYTEANGPRFVHDLLERLRQLPDVQAAAAARVVPGGFEGIRFGGITTPGFTPADGQRMLFPNWNVVEPGYFATLRIPMIGGRDFNASDAAGAPPVIILSESLARRFWPGQEATGKYVNIDATPPMPPMMVVGVARDIKTSSLIDGLADPFVYVPLQQRFGSGPPPLIIAARSASGRRLTDDIRGAVRAMDPNLPIVTAQTLEDSTALGLVVQRIVASVSGSLGSIGLLLAAIGIYGVTAYTVARRGREIGIRVALGARRRDIVAMVVRQGIWLAGVGAAIGLALAALASQVLAGFLFGLPPLDPPTFIGAALLFATIAVLASYIPARRATRVDPLAVLRRE
jgi:predicted permease